VVVTCGSTEAMMTAMMTACNPGDKVIIFSPYYENYGADTILSGARPIYVPLRPPDFNFDPDELRAAFMQEPQSHRVVQSFESVRQGLLNGRAGNHRRPGQRIRHLRHHR
jgi:aspartate/methionine/tyrosine aminotransferase